MSNEYRLPVVLLCVCVWPSVDVSKVTLWPLRPLALPLYTSTLYATPGSRLVSVNCGPDRLVLLLTTPPPATPRRHTSAVNCWGRPPSKPALQDTWTQLWLRLVILQLWGGSGTPVEPDKTVYNFVFDGNLSLGFKASNARRSVNLFYWPSEKKVWYSRIE